MPSSFTFKLSRLRKRGPTCWVTIKPSEPTIKELKLGKKKVPSFKILALIDTGASSTAVSREVIKKLKLVPRGMVEVYTSNKVSEMRNEFDISLAFDENAYLPLLRVLEANLQDHKIDCLIGRDVLQFGVFTYNGPKKQVKLSF